MKFIGLILALIVFVPVKVNAANDVYGTVSEIHTRSANNANHLVYFRLSIIPENSTFESCVINENTLVWYLDLSSSVHQYQYAIIQKSYIEQLPIRIIGHSDVCDNGPTYSDRIFELSPWSWPHHIANKNN